MDDEDSNPFKNHELDKYHHINQLLREDSDKSKIDAANFMKDILGQPHKVSTGKGAWLYLQTIWRSLLDNDMYREAATMHWGYDVVDCRPKLVNDYFDFLQTNNLMCVLGASSVSKSYGGVAWLYLDYQRDPDYTAIKLVTISASKLEGLLFSPMKTLAEQGMMDTVGQSYPGFRFTHKDDNLNVGFEGILVPQDQKGTGKVKGIKYFRRNKRHPVFGISGRTRIFIDEFQDTSPGIINDLNSPASQISDPYGMKIILSGNPTDYSLSQAFGRVAEPEKGWAEIDIDKDHYWKSKMGYKVMRLDGAQCENVIHRQNLCVGMISHQAYDNFCVDKNAPEYFTFARGMFPISGSASTLFNVTMLEASRGDAMFHEGAINVGFLDVALRGDKAVLAHGKIGLATGRIDLDGERVMFTRGTQDDERRPKLILQVDKLEVITDFDSDTMKLSHEVRKRCNALNIQPAHLGVDATGMGEGVASYLSNYFGPVLAVHNGNMATDKKILKEDKKLPKELYDRIASELWYAAHKWFSVRAILLSREIEQKDQLFREWTTRLIGKKSVNGKDRMETKEEWRKRNQGKSPDFADVVNGLVHVCRMRTQYMPAMDSTGESVTSAVPFKPANVDYVESLHFNGLTDTKKQPRFDIAGLRNKSPFG